MLEIKNTLVNLAQLEKVILINTIGVIESLERKLITIEDAEKAIFSPKTMELLRRRGVDTVIIDLILQGMELEDVESLIPERLEDSIHDLKRKAVFLLAQRKEVSFEENILK